MTKKIRIKDIARMARVSAGTVDRVLHNRGNVSIEAKEAIERVLEEVDYKPNIHISAISLKKRYNIAIVIPAFEPGEYWETVYQGIEAAQNEYSSLNFTYTLHSFDQFDQFSCKDAYERLLQLNFDAVILAVVFVEETRKLTEKLKSRGVPYLFIDSTVEHTTPIAHVSTDHYSCGYLGAKLLDLVTEKGSKIAIFQSMVRGSASSTTPHQREKGLRAYQVDKQTGRELVKAEFSTSELDINAELLDEFFKQHSDIKGGIVLNSRAYIIADYIRNRKLSGFKLVGIDLIEENARAMESGDVEFLIGQRSVRQGFVAIELMLEYLVYGKMPTLVNHMPLDIITIENIELHKREGESFLIRNS